MILQIEELKHRVTNYSKITKNSKGNNKQSINNNNENYSSRTNEDKKSSGISNTSIINNPVNIHKTIYNNKVNVHVHINQENNENRNSKNNSKDNIDSSSNLRNKKNNKLKKESKRHHRNFSEQTSINIKDKLIKKFEICVYEKDFDDNKDKDFNLNLISKFIELFGILESEFENE